MQEKLSTMLDVARSKKKDVVYGAIGAAMMLHSTLVVKEKISSPPGVSPIIAGVGEAVAGSGLIAGAAVNLFDSKPTTPTPPRRRR